MSVSGFRNAGICGLCGEEIESTYRHDFKQCKCQNLFVDGGKDYQRFGYDPTRERGNSVIWNNVELCWNTVKELEIADEQSNEGVSSTQGKRRKLMLTK